jgi:hypothetical protein
MGLSEVVALLSPLLPFLMLHSIVVLQSVLAKFLMLLVLAYSAVVGLLLSFVLFFLALRFVSVIPSFFPITLLDMVHPAVVVVVPLSSELVLRGVVCLEVVVVVLFFLLPPPQPFLRFFLVAVVVGPLLASSVLVVL